MRLAHLGLPAIVVMMALTACSGGVSLKSFAKAREKACACTTATCASNLAADVHHLQTLGSEPEPECRPAPDCKPEVVKERPGDCVQVCDDRPTTEAKAKAYLDAAYACAVKLDPAIGAKLEAALAH